MLSTARIGVDAYVIDSLMRDLVGHDRRASAFVLYLHLWRRTHGGGRSVVVSHQTMSDGTGLAKRSVQEALKHLERRGLVHVRRAGATSEATVTLICEWRAG